LSGTEDHSQASHDLDPARPAVPDLRLKRTLQDLAEFIEMAEVVTSRTRAAYDADITLRLAGEAIVIRVGEAVGRLPENFREMYPDIPWRSIKGARNLTSHNYHHIDSGVIWRAFEPGRSGNWSVSGACWHQ
jgi:uncharacterized protein with HEPN domain